MSHAPTIIMYSPDAIGLGHVRRNTSIASAVIRSDPAANVVMMIGSAVGNVFEAPAGIDSIKLPSVQKTGSNDWRARSLNLSTEATRRIRAGLMRETIDALRPDVFLVDHLPAGIWSELVPVFEFIRSRGLKTRIVLGLRDILDDPLRIRTRWAQDGTYDIIRDFYDAIFIYGDERIYPSAKVYGLTGDVCSQITYTGYVGPDLSSAGAALPRPLDAHLAKQPGERRVVITAGGGHDAYPMMSATLKALAQTPGADSLKSIMVTGPLMAADDRAKLRAEAAGMPVTIVPFTNQLKALLDTADLVVTMGGYNSMIETAALGKPTINVPRSGPSREQSIRAELFAKFGLLRYVPLDAASADVLGKEIVEGIDRKVVPRLTLPMSGATLAAKQITMLAATASRRPRAPVFTRGTELHVVA
jgi:predicted glycosyltransferase